MLGLGKSENQNALSLFKDERHQYKTKTKFAFTLAEVLITIVVIGVIAAITVPIIANKYNRQIVETRLGHTYAVLANMFKRAEVDYGSIDSWNLEEYNEWADSYGDVRDAFVQKYMIPYLNIKNYERKTWSEFGYKKGILYPNGEKFKLPTASINGLTLLDGVFITFSMNYYQYNNKYICYSMWIMADIDGPHKGPNTLGKDVFYFQQYLVNGVPLLMYGEYGTAYRWYSGSYDISSSPEAIVINRDTGVVIFRTDKRASREEIFNKCKAGNATDNNSQVCGALIKLNGWKIPKDYPWL